MPTHIPAQDLEHGQDSIQRFPPSAQEVQITSMVHGHITFFNASLLFNYTMQKDAVMLMNRNPCFDTHLNFA